jgi:hypothetical protein
VDIWVAYQAIFKLMATEQMTVGIICEGPTDSVVLRRVVTTFTGNKDIVYTPLQPVEDGDGNWDKVLKYCASDDFKEFLTTTDGYAVVQIDTDWLLGDGVPEEYRIPLVESLNALQLLDAMKGLILRQMGEEFYELYASRIILAIAVSETECWFLAIYYDDRKKASKTESCIKHLNDALKKALSPKERFYIDGKDLSYYRTLCTHFKKKKDLLVYSKPNESFNAFVAELAVKLPVQES